MPSSKSTASQPAAAFLLLAACAAPTLLAWNVAPSATFLNQALAFALWGWFILFTAPLAASPLGAGRAGAAVMLALALCAAATLATATLAALPWSLALSLLAALAAAALVLLQAAALAQAGSTRASWAFETFCLGLLTAGVLGSAIAAVQVFWPELADGQVIAASGIPGRAVGNLRQPNHLSSVLLWACVALVALAQLRAWRSRWVAALGSLLVAAVVLTASRTGLLSVFLLAAWGLLDRRLQRRLRLALVAAPVAYAAAWRTLAWWSQVAGHRFGGAERLAETDISGSRFAIWADTLALIREQPWFGVGMGEFNLAWSLTPFPKRPVAFFDHAHNLPLHLAAELGLPLAALVLGLLLWGLWQLLRAAMRTPGTTRVPGEAPGVASETDAGLVLQRATLVLVLMIALHSLLEYPLWYAYFLLPTAWVWGLALGAARSGSAPEPASAGAMGVGHTTQRRAAPNTAWSLAGAAMVAMTAYALIDYWRVVVIFSAPAGAAPLAERIAAGQRSLFFSHHADYAAATTAPEGSSELQPFRGAAHFLLDTRIMLAWADALHAAGRVDEARHLAARMREFRNPDSADYFAACQQPATLAPYQCQPPLAPHPWRDFTR